jgi:hypothetical protein
MPGDTQMEDGSFRSCSCPAANQRSYLEVDELSYQRPDGWTIFGSALQQSGYVSWIDSCMLSEDGSTYWGQNQERAAIVGEKVK